MHSVPFTLIFDSLCTILLIVKKLHTVIQDESAHMDERGLVRVLMNVLGTLFALSH